MIEGVESWRWVLFALLAAAAISDIRSLRIPNILPLLTGASALALLSINGAPIADFVSSAISGIAGLFVGYLLFAARLLGAGDGKLFAAASMWFPAGALLGVALLISISGLLVGACCFALNALKTAEGGQSALGAAMKSRMPYGVAIAAGFVAAAQLSAFAGSAGMQ